MHIQSHKQGTVAPGPAPPRKSAKPPLAQPEPELDDGLPAWKRELLKAKAAKEHAANAPARRQSQADAEKQAKLAAMPAWKRALLEKKQGGH